MLFTDYEEKVWHAFWMTLTSLLLQDPDQGYRCEVVERCQCDLWDDAHKCSSRVKVERIDEV